MNKKFKNKKNKLHQFNSKLRKFNYNISKFEILYNNKLHKKLVK